MSVILLLLKNLLMTVLIEGTLVLIFLKKTSALYHSVLVNMLTNPLLNFCLLLWASFVPLPAVPFYYVATAVLEIGAFVTEGFLYHKMGDFGLKKAFFASLLLNAASFLCGLLL